MLINYIFDEKYYQLLDKKDRHVDSNVFTMLVGKNGTGKSRLLSSLVRETISLISTGESQRELDFTDSHRYEYPRISYDILPERVVAMSTSPFDKFPLPGKNKRNYNYRYLGLRDIPSHNFGLAYMSKIMGELLSTVIHRPDQISDIFSVLKYLGYTSTIRLRVESRINQKFIDTMYSYRDFVEGFKHAVSLGGMSVQQIRRSFMMDESLEISNEKVYRFYDILTRWEIQNDTRRSEIYLHQDGISSHPNLPEDPRDILFLLEIGAITLRGVELHESVNDKIFSISSASSGQQCIVLGILGIASQICDNALICIDEPEICLHPEWQERYIKILMSTFRAYRNCHFIIATHSPQIISNLESTNCYILNMEDLSLINANMVNHNSADFQLANVFKAPGFKNEFLSRIALNTFAKVNKYKRFDDEDFYNLRLLSEVRHYFDATDPLIALVFSLEKMRELYA